MRKRRSLAKSTLAIVVLIATVLNTGFSSLASEIVTDDGIVVENTVDEDKLDAHESSATEDTATDDSVQIEVVTSSEDEAEEVKTQEDESDDDSIVIETSSSVDEDTSDVVEDMGEGDTAETEDSEEEIMLISDEEGTVVEETEEVFEEAEELKAGTLELSEGSVTGTGYDEISVYVSTEKLDRRDTFYVEFSGPDSASYNPIINEEMDKTNEGYLDFTDLDGQNFTVRAKSSDNVEISYKYNEDGYPMIELVSKDAEKILESREIEFVNGDTTSAIFGAGYDSLDVALVTDDLSDNVTYKLVVDTEAQATVNGNSANDGIDGLGKDDTSVNVENLDKEEFRVYVVAEKDDIELYVNASVINAEAGKVSIYVSDVASKTVYEYEDDKIYVRATIEKADAIPDDAYFSVEPVKGNDAEKYLDALNEEAGEVDDNGELIESYSEDNSLLYDIAFYTDETKTKEIEPEEGSVTVIVNFKDNQLKEELGVQEDTDVEVNHIIENGSNLEVEKIDADASVVNEEVELVTEEFSIFVFTVNGRNKSITVKNPGSETPVGVLGDAWTYGITANTWKFNKEAETSFAVGKITGIDGALNGGQTGVNSSKAEGSSYQYSMVASVDGYTKIKGYPVSLTIPKSEQDKIVHESGSSKIKYINKEAADINADITNMINYVATESSRMAELDSVVSYNNDYSDNNGHFYIDITSAPDGTYYIDLDKCPRLKYSMSQNGQTHIKKNKGQRLVFNTKDTDVSFDKYIVEQDGQTYDSTAIADMSSAKNPLVEDFIFNMPKAKTVHLQDMAGLFLATKATVTFGGVGGGWLVCSTAISNAEWHFVNGKLPTPKDGSTELELEITKNFVDYEGNAVDSSLWPAEGFKFKIEKYPCNDPGDVNGSEVEHDINYIPDLGISEVVIKSDTPGHKASFGKLKFSGKDVFNNARAHYTGSNPRFLCFMYKITEVDTGATGVVYDSKPRYIKIFVNSEKSTDNDGTIEYRVWTETKVNDNVLYYNCEPGMPEFTNYYYKAGVTLGGQKTINNSSEAVPSHEFSFKLYQYSNDKKWNSEPIETVTNDGSRFEFNELDLDLKKANGYNTGATYSNDVTEAYFYYKITESDCNSPYSKDNHAYIAKVTLKKRDSGITSSVEYFRYDNEAAANAASLDSLSNSALVSTMYFNNTYSAHGSVTLHAKKVLENAELSSKNFTFQLFERKDGVDTPIGSPIANNGQTGNIDFAAIDYPSLDSVGTHTYVIKEVIPSGATADNGYTYQGITYDTNEYVVNVEVTDAGNGTLTATSDRATELNRVQFTNVYNARGSLTFTATKYYEAGSNMPEGKKFTFVLKEGNTVIDTQEVLGANTVSFTTLNFSKNPGEGEYATGTHNYTIEEVIPAGADSNNVFQGVKYDTTKHSISVDVIDGADGSLIPKVNGEPKAVFNVGFTNGYETKDTEANISGVKELKGKSLEAGMFTFKLEAASADTVAAVENGNVILPSEVETTNAANGDFEFDNITFKTTGTFTFKVTEDSSDPIEGISYDASEFFVTFVISDVDGQLTVASKNVTKGSSSAESIKFTNYYAENEVYLVAHKTLTGKGLTASQFEFELKDSEGHVIETQVPNDASGNVNFSKISYTLSDLGADNSRDYTYYISEICPDKDGNGYTYDRSVKTVIVTVSKPSDYTEGKLVITTNYVDGAAEFVNTYKTSGSLVFGGTKKIIGRKFLNEDDGKFKAVLYTKAGDKIDTADIVKDTSGIWGDKGGKFTFAPIEYKAEGTYEYVVKEEGLSVEGITNDTTMYEVVVSVVDDGKGNLTATPTYKYNNTEVEGINFNNTYDANGKATVVARKTIDFGSLQKDQFKFELKDESGKVYTARNKADGSVVFEQLEYNLEDLGGKESETFYYTISEVDESKPGYTYSTKVYDVSVLVENVAGTELKTTVKYFDNGTDVTSTTGALFENKYTTEGKVQLSLKKKLLGRAMDPGQFEFLLYNEVGELVQRVPVIAEEEGKFATVTFDEWTLKQEDLQVSDLTHTHRLESGEFVRFYTIREYVPINNIPEGYTYDYTVYNVQVTFADDGKGHIDADWKAYKAGDSLEEYNVFELIWNSIVEFFTGEDVDKKVEFVNKYVAKGQVQFKAHKTVTGTTAPKAGDFAFVLEGKDSEGKDFSEPVSIDDDGNVTFSLIEYTEPSMEPYVYTIREVIPAESNKKKGFVYDETVYTATVTVSDTGTGVLSVSTVISDGTTTRPAVESEIIQVTDGKIGLCSPVAVEFVNDYSTTGTDVTIGGTKSVASRTIDIAEGEFKFVIEGINGTTLPAGYNNEALVKADRTYTFAPISYVFADLGGEQKKTFEYQISEVKLDDASINYSTDKKIVTVEVVDNGDGTMSATPTYADGAAFVNTYNASNKVQFYAKKVVDGTNNASRDFTFKLTGDKIDSEVPMTVTVKNNEVKFFDEIEYTLADLDGAASKEFKYVIEEVKPAEADKYAGYTYSDEKYNITVTVSNDRADGKLSVDYQVEGSDEENTCDDVIFHNSYKANGFTKITGKKTLLGRDLSAGEFQFGLYKSGETTPVATTTNDKNGDFYFTGDPEDASAEGYTTALQFDQTQLGDSNFEVKEIVPADADKIANVEYNVNGDVYSVKVTVEDTDNNSVLKVTPVITDVTKNNQTVDKASFVNQFTDSASVSFAAYKELRGRALADAEFSFTLKQTKGGDIADFATKSLTLFNDGTAVNFGSITFNQDEVGEYEFTISENVLNEKNVAYNITKELYTAKVVVSIKNGRLDVDKKVYNKDGNLVANPLDVKFINEFTSSDDVKFAGNKKLVGFNSDKIKKGEYQFQIIGTGDTKLPEGYVSVVDVKADGSYEFSPITYDQDVLFVENVQLPSRQFTYEVREVVNSEANMVHYDETVYHITVTVSIVNGQLVANASTSESVAVNELDFTNEYTADGKWHPYALKTITGKNIADKAYTFNITATDEEHNALTGDKAYTDTVKNDGKDVWFSEISFTQNDIGNHYYTVTETLSEDGSVIDSSKYYVTVTVDVNDDNTLSISKAYTKVAIKDGKEEVTHPSEMVFKNTFTDSDSVKIGGDKILIGRKLNAEDFEFVLKGDDGTELKAYNAAAEMNDNMEAQSSFEFAEITYDQDSLADGNGGYLESKDFTYTVYETDKVQRGVTNSKAIYKVVVTLKYIDGKLTAVKSAPQSMNADAKEEGTLATLIGKLFGTSEKKIVFINEYYAVGEIDPEGIKHLTGRLPKDGEFSFIIDELELNENGEPTGNVINSGVIKNYSVNGVSRIKFDSSTVCDAKNGYFLKYSTNGEAVINGQTVKCTKVGATETKHMYRIHEDTSKKIDGVTYDDKVVEFTVNVSDTANGILVVKDNSGEAWDAIEESLNESLQFYNKFEAVGAVEIAGTKSMDGRNLTKAEDYDESLARGKYAFTITDIATGESKTVYNELTNGVPSLIRFTGKDDKDANYVPFLSYKSTDADAIGTHEYKIVEEDYNSNGVLSDKNYYIMKVVVSYADKDGNPVDGTDTDNISSNLYTKIESVKKFNGKGVLLANDAVANLNSFEFINQFKASAPFSVNGKKALVDGSGVSVGNASALKGKYTFALYKYSNPERTADKELIATADTDSNGVFQFNFKDYFTQKDLRNKDNSYSTSKDLYFKLVEVTPTEGSWVKDENGKQVWEDRSGVRYDDTEYNIDVTVSYNGTSTLDVKKVVSYKDAEGKDVTVTSADYDTSFKNVLQEYVEIAGTKYWVDKVADSKDRPDVVISLYSSAVNNGKTAINTYTIVAPNKAYSFKTDKDGNKLPKYVDGKKVVYTVDEADIDGYLSEKNGYDFYNTAGNITIRKIDSVTKEAVAGATLAIITSAGKEVERWTSTQSAHVVATQLEAGTVYYLREIEAPDGYVVAADVAFTVPKDGSDITVTMEDTPIVGSVRLVKRDSSTRDALAGAEFAMYSYNGDRVYATGTTGSYRYTTSTSNGVFVTDGAGTLTVTDLPYGTYYFVETKAPSGYELSTEHHSFSVTENGALVEVTALNTKAEGSVRLRKINATGTRSLAGAVFELYVATPQTIGQAATSTIFSDAYYRYGTYRTNAAGEIYVDGLPWDDYYFIEIEAPTGYVISNDVTGDQLVYTFTVDSTATETIELGGITNNAEEGDRTRTTTTIERTTTPQVLGERIEKGGVMSGVLGVRAKPTSGVLGERVGPVTGDFSNIALWLLLLVACVAMIITMLVKTSPKNKKAKARK